MARQKLTAASVGRLKLPASGQLDIFDKGFPGLVLRLSYAGARSWYLVYKLHGKARRLKLGQWPAMTLAEAREAWRQARNQVDRGFDPAAKRPAMGAGAVIDEWLKRDQAGNRSAKLTEQLIANHVLPHWQHRNVDELTRRDVLDVIDRVADAGYTAQAGRVHRKLHRLFAWCLERGILERSPMLGMRGPAPDVRRDRVLSDDELARVWKAAGAIGWPFGIATKLLILTGARKNEIWQARWGELRAAELVLAVGRTKTGNPHTIPLSTVALELVNEIPRIVGSDYLFALRSTPSRHWTDFKRELDQLAGVHNWVIHDLRRTVATGLERMGVALQVTEAILGHVSGSKAGVIGIYQRHGYDKEKRAALEAWASAIRTLTKAK
jgi:integrase